MSNSNTEIGGAHPLPEHTWYKDFKFENKYCYYTSNARSAIYFAKTISKCNKVWLPSYTCNCLLYTELNYSLYEVDKNLKIKIPKKVKSNDLFVIIEYFGCHQNINVDCFTLYDKSQSMFNDPKGTFSVYSFTKNLGYPDGGLLVSDIDYPDILEPANSTCFEISKQFRTYRLENNPEWYKTYLQYKEITKPFGHFRMSDFTRANLGNNLYNQFLKNLNNYNVLAKKITSFINIKENIPSGFPIKVKDRNKVQKELAEKYNIYCPIHWDIEGNELSEKILTLPCDYRYSESNMEFILYALEKLSIDTL